MAAGSSTDVPPNFITTRLMRIFLWFVAEVAADFGELLKNSSRSWNASLRG
jgi:hypothetical protein